MGGVGHGLGHTATPGRQFTGTAEMGTPGLNETPELVIRASSDIDRAFLNNMTDILWSPNAFEPLGLLKTAWVDVRI